jgi:hypothetical protein
MLTSPEEGGNVRDKVTWNQVWGLQQNAVQSKIALSLLFRAVERGSHP